MKSLGAASAVALVVTLALGACGGDGSAVGSTAKTGITATERGGEVSPPVLNKPATAPSAVLTAGDVATTRQIGGERMDAPGAVTAVKLAGTAARSRMPPCVNVPTGHACLVVRVDEHVRQGLTPQRPGATPSVILVVEVVVDATNGRQVSYLASPVTTPGLSRLGVPVAAVQVG